MKMLNLLVVAALAAATPLCRGDSSESAAQAAAATWLALVDGGNYYQSWATAADYFRNSISRTQWVARVGAAREPLGALKELRLLSAREARSLPGAPDGDYVVIEYASRFVNKAEATETVTPVREPDGHWRVSGYFVR